MSAKDVARMVRNASIIEKAIVEFEQDIVSRIRMDGLSPQEFYGPGARKHPPTLTPTERPRFICSYYALWSLMTVDRSTWEPRLQAMTSQELYYVQEMTKLTQRIGREEIPPSLRFPHDPSYPFDFHDHDQEQKRIDLRSSIWEQIQRNSWRFFKSEAQGASIFAMHEGFL
ncbi:hypothetical protein MMC11_006412, partial [Xylographa trunciseda]|nr:hypothetical protein [Xylographa trunciseda]